MEPGDKLGSDPTVLENRLSSLDEITVLPIERLDQWTTVDILSRAARCLYKHETVPYPYQDLKLFPVCGKRNDARRPTILSFSWTDQLDGFRQLSERILITLGI
jgi:hypothetical protein